MIREQNDGPMSFNDAQNMPRMQQMQQHVVAMTNDNAPQLQQQHQPQQATAPPFAPVTAAQPSYESISSTHNHPSAQYVMQPYNAQQQQQQQPLNPHTNNYDVPEKTLPSTVATLKDGDKLNYVPDYSDDLSGMRDEMLPQAGWIALSFVALFFFILAIAFFFTKHSDYKDGEYEYIVAALIMMSFALIAHVLGLLSNVLLGTVHSRIVTICYWHSFALHLAAAAFTLPFYDFTSLSKTMEAGYACQGIGLVLHWLLCFLVSLVTVNPLVDRAQFMRNVSMESAYAELSKHFTISQQECATLKAENARLNGEVALLQQQSTHTGLNQRGADGGVHVDEYNEMVDLMNDTKKELERAKATNARLRRHNEKLRQQLQDHGIRAAVSNQEDRALTMDMESINVDMRGQVQALQASVAHLRAENDNLRNANAHMNDDKFQDLQARYNLLNDDFEALKVHTRGGGRFTPTDKCANCDQREKTLLILESKLEHLNSEKIDVIRLSERNDELQRELKRTKTRMAELRKWQIQTEAFVGSKVTQLHDHITDFGEFQDNIRSTQESVSLMNLRS